MDNMKHVIDRIFRVAAAILSAVLLLDANAGAAFAAGEDNALTDASDPAYDAATSDIWGADDVVSPGQAGYGNEDETLPAEEFRIEVSLVSPAQASGAILIENAHEKDIYIAAVAVSSFESDARLIWIDGLRVRSTENGMNGSRLVYSGYDGEERKSLVSGKTYDIYASPYEKLGVGREPESGYFDKDAVYIGSITVTGSTGETAPLAGAALKFKAVTQKNQNIKLTWKINKRDDRQAQYKLFNIKRLVAGEYGDDTWQTLKTAHKKKNYTDKQVRKDGVAHAAGCMYMLECCSESGDILESYIAVAAPYLFYTRTDYEQEDAEFGLTSLTDSDNMMYRLQTAKTKAAFKSAEQASEVTFCDRAAAGLADIAYRVSAGLTASAVRPVYSVSGSDMPEYSRLKLGEKAFFRAKTIYFYRGVAYTSEASNVIGKKVGPVKCQVLSVGGVNPEIAYGDDPVSPNQRVHHDSNGTCYKEGYITFYGIDGHKDVQYYELLRSTVRYGGYKAVKKLKPETVKKLGISTSSSDANLYYVKYNNFPPEKTCYYAVRAVAKKTAGGFSDGEENRTEFEKVYGFTATDTGLSSAKLVWNHDDCAKQYWIYRANGVVTAEEGSDALTQTQLNTFKRIKKVNASRVAKKTITDEYGKNGVRVNSFTDSFSITPGRAYTWIVRPVYNTGAAKALLSEMSYLSKPLSCTPTVTAEASSEVTAATASIRQITVKWSVIDHVDGYEIQRTADKAKVTVIGSSEDEKKIWEDTPWETVYTFKQGGAEFKNLSFIDAVPETGVFYYYRVRGLSGDDHTKWDVPSSKGKAASASAKPMAVENLKVERLDAGSGASSDLYRYGARLSWTLNSRDAAYLATLGDSMKYNIEYSDDGGASWSNLATGKAKTGTSYDDTYTTLSRGKVRRYRVRIVFSGENGTEHNGAYKTENYSKPKGLSALDSESKEIETISLTPSSNEMTIKIYSYIGKTTAEDGKVSLVHSTVKELDGMYSESGREAMSEDNNIVRVTGVTLKDGCAAVTIKAVGSGTAKLKLRTYDYGWTTGGDSSTLTKTITVTVK